MSVDQVAKQRDQMFVKLQTSLKRLSKDVDFKITAK